MSTDRSRFVLQGFHDSLGFRDFQFERVAQDWSRQAFTVRTDLSMSRKYGIRLQELPLLCLALLENHAPGEMGPVVVYTEAAMSSHADGVAARLLAAKTRKPPRRAASQAGGAAWRQSSPYPPAPARP